MTDRENLLPGHRGAMEEQGVRRKGRMRPTFKTPTMQWGTLCNEDVLHDGYWPKMLLYALDEIFYVFDQVKRQ